MGTIFSGSIGTSIEKMEKKSIGTGIDKFGIKKSRNRYRKNLIWKKYWYRYQKYLVPEKVSVLLFNILGTVTYWLIIIHNMESIPGSVVSLAMFQRIDSLSFVNLIRCML